MLPLKGPEAVDKMWGIHSELELIVIPGLSTERSRFMELEAQALKRKMLMEQQYASAN